MRDLTRRVEALESRAAPAALAELSGSLDQLAARITTLAGRYRETPAPSVERQSHIERIIRSALAAADGAEGDVYTRRFWRAVADGLRAYASGRAA